MLAFLAWIAFLAVARATSLDARVTSLLPDRWAPVVHDWIEALRWSGFAVLVFAWLWLSRHTPVIVDARVYGSIHLDHLYTKGPNEIGAYLYSPAFAQVLAPFSALDWRAFYALWTVLDIAALTWLLGPISAALSLGFPLVAQQVWVGNIHIFVAVALVISLRHASAWAFPILTKVTPAVGLLWLLGRRDWRALGTACLATMSIATVSFVVAPGLWFDWVHLLVAGAGSSSALPQGLLPLSLAERLAIGAAIALLGGWSGRAWTIPAAVIVAQPIFWTIGLTTLFAVVPMAGTRVRSIGAAGPSSAVGAVGGA